MVQPCLVYLVFAYICLWNNRSEFGKMERIHPFEIQIFIIQMCESFQ